ncbi:MAG: hypothetical protein RH942_13805 [Kiloniellaceae bacterium]
MRLSLCRVDFVQGCDTRLAQIDDPSLIAELAEDGSLIVIFIHPQGVGDAEAASGVSARLEQGLRKSGLPHYALKIAIMHCDAAAIDVSDTTLAVMAGLPHRPLVSMTPPAVAVS